MRVTSHAEEGGTGVEEVVWCPLDCIVGELEEALWKVGGAPENEGAGLPQKAGISCGLADLPKGFDLYSKSHYKLLLTLNWSEEICAFQITALVTD